MVDYLCIIQARLNSTRLPAKIMLDLAGKTLLERVYETVSKSKKINKIIIATSDEKTDDIVEKKLQTLNIEYYRGSLNNVLERFFMAAKKYRAKNIIRITADNPLMDAKVIDNLILHYESNNSQYSVFKKAIYGLTAEVFSYQALSIANENARNDYDKEHVTPYIKDNCIASNIDIEKKYRKSNLSITIDTIEDYIKMQNLYLYFEKNKIEPSVDNYLFWVDNGEFI